MDAIVMVGTGHLAGKTMLATALCRLLKQRGRKVAPFKAEAVTSISYMTESGVEIDYFQALQAWAAGTAPDRAFNPVLRHTSSARGPQVLVDGRALVVDPDRVMGDRQTYLAAAEDAIAVALTTLGKRYNAIVCDGLGSPADRPIRGYELNNFVTARRLDARVLLVIDADRGGWLGHTIGLLSLLDPADRDRIGAFVVNRYRGPRDRLQPGIDWLQERTGLPCLGAIPWIGDFFPSPDSIDLFARRRRRSDVETSIVAVRLPHMDHFSDLDPLAVEPTVGVRYVNLDGDLGYPDAAILPRTSNLAADLQALHESGMAEALTNYGAAGGTILGLGEGLQMLGKSVVQFQGIDADSAELAGIGLLPVATIVTAERVNRARSVVVNHPIAGLPLSSQEVRCGYTQVLDSDAVENLFDDPKLGVVSTNHLVWGSYMPGMFDSGPWRRAWLNRLRHQRGLGSLPTGIPDYQEHREILVDGLVEALAPHVDWDRAIELLSS